MDIQLADGISFEIFEQCQVTAPVIFTTAYEAYAVKAFKVNGLDYILKPVDKQELGVALTKLRLQERTENGAEKLLQNMSEAVRMLLKKYKTRFVIKVGEHLKTIEVGDIRYFYSQDKATFCVTQENRNFILDYTLEHLEEMVDPGQFFRVNRKYLVSAAAIHDIISYTNSRLKLVLKGSHDTDIIVARERVQEFKSWLDK
jgi:DNA-binding LytR/AlgR family response regulator